MDISYFSGHTEVQYNSHLPDCGFELPANLKTMATLTPSARESATVVFWRSYYSQLHWMSISNFIFFPWVTLMDIFPVSIPLILPLSHILILKPLCNCVVHNLNTRKCFHPISIPLASTDPSERHSGNTKISNSWPQTRASCFLLCCWLNLDKSLSWH